MYIINYYDEEGCLKDTQSYSSSTSKKQLRRRAKQHLIYNKGEYSSAKISYYKNNVIRTIKYHELKRK